MAMKFPLKERPFDSIKLSPQRYDELERTAEQIVDVTLQEFRDFVDLQNRVMDKSQWKPVKKRDNVIVFKELTARHERTFGAFGAPSASNPMLLPKLVAVGSVRGMMDDMLMGVATRDAASVLVKSSYVDDLIVDCSVLHQMHGATMDNPFRFVGLKWMVKAHPTGLGSVMAPRDMVFVQSSGWIPEEGIGYHMLHSVEIPEYASLEAKHGILRSRVSTMFIFRQLTPELVEIYMVNYVEPNGSAPESVCIMSTAASMCGSWKALGCAHNMKLSWILKNKEAYVGKNHAADGTMSTGDKCELCHRRATLTGRLADCALCETRVCSRCRVTKKLSKVSRRLELTTEKHEVCKTCFVRVMNEDASRVASEMNAGAPITPWNQGSQLPTRKYSFANSHSDHSSHSSQRETVTTLSSSDAWIDRGSDLHSLAYGPRTIGDRDRDDDVESVILEPVGRESCDNDWSGGKMYQPHYPPAGATWARPEQSHSQSLARTQPGVSQDYIALYSQMKSLQLTAERTYKLTRDNTRMITDGRTSA